MGTPPTFVDGTAVHATDLAWITTWPLCVLTQTSTTSLSGSMTNLLWDTEITDVRDSQHSLVSNTDRILIGNTLGWYRVHFNVAFSSVATTAGQTRRADIALSAAGGALTSVNGSQIIVPGATGTFQSVSGVAVVQATNAADYIVVRAQHDGTTSPSTWVSGSFRSLVVVEWIGT